MGPVICDIGGTYGLAGVNKILHWMRKQREGVAEDCEARLLVLYQDPCLLNVNVHAAGVKWEVEVPETKNGRIALFA